MSTNETALAVSPQRSTALAITPSSPEQLFQMATWIGKSKMYSGITTPEAAFTVMLRGLEMGIPMSVALTEIKPFESGGSIKLSVSSRLLESMAASDPDVEYIRMQSSDANQATYVAKKKGEPEIEHTFTMADAKVAGLDTKDNWKKYPKAMLRAAAARELSRIISPRKTIGLRTADEIDEDDVAFRPEAVTALPTVTRSVVLDSTAEPTHDSDGVVQERVNDNPAGHDEEVRVCILLAQVRDATALAVGRDEIVRVWPPAKKGAQPPAPADVLASYAEAKRRVAAIAAGG